MCTLSGRTPAQTEAFVIQNPDMFKRRWVRLHHKVTAYKCRQHLVGTDEEMHVHMQSSVHVVRLIIVVNFW